MDSPREREHGIRALQLAGSCMPAWWRGTPRLVPGEEIRTNVRRKHSQISARSGQILQPARRSAKYANADQSQIVSCAHHCFLVDYTVRTLQYRSRIDARPRTGVLQHLTDLSQFSNSTNKTRARARVGPSSNRNSVTPHSPRHLPTGQRLPPAALLSSAIAARHSAL